MNKRERRSRQSEGVTNFAVAGIVSVLALVVAYAVTGDDRIYACLGYLSLAESFGFAIYLLTGS